MCVGPALSVPVGDLVRAQEAVAEGIVLLQQAQQTEWRSIAADAMRAELYSAIQVLRGIDAALADARADVARCLAELDSGAY